MLLILKHQLVISNKDMFYEYIADINKLCNNEKI